MVFNGPRPTAALDAKCRGFVRTTLAPQSTAPRANSTPDEVWQFGFGRWYGRTQSLVCLFFDRTGKRWLPVGQIGTGLFTKRNAVRSRLQAKPWFNLRIQRRLRDSILQSNKDRTWSLGGLPNCLGSPAKRRLCYRISVERTKIDHFSQSDFQKSRSVVALGVPGQMHGLTGIRVRSERSGSFESSLTCLDGPNRQRLFSRFGLQPEPVDPVFVLLRRVARNEWN